MELAGATISEIDDHEVEVDDQEIETDAHDMAMEFVSAEEKRHEEDSTSLVISARKKALATVSGNIIQDKMDKEHEKLLKEQAQEHKKSNRKDSTKSTGSVQPPKLQDYCPTGVYVSMVITYPAEVVKFQIVRPDPEPELEGLQRVSINIDDSNFPQIFPDRHVKFLDRLKQHKRPAAEDETTKSTKKSKIAMTRAESDPLPRDY
ncbi:hypothetical protein BGX26_003380 [Mortierella sp. AD094]|nr:hypothetical protein BGX26_003380 [Mortierella sp. AD094]